MLTKNRKKKIKIDVSYSAIFKVLLVILLIVFMYLIRSVLLVFFVAFIIASAIIPAVNKMEEKGVPRFLSVLLLYLIIISLVIVGVILIVPPVVNQFGQLATNLPDYYQKTDAWLQKFVSMGIISENFNFSDLIQTNFSSFISNSRAIFDTLGGVIGGIFAFILSLIISFYITVQKDSLEKLAKLLSPRKKRIYVVSLISKIQNKMGSWLKGQLILCFLIGVLAYIGLLALGIKYAVVLAVIAGITEIIPYVGPFVGGGAAVLIALTQSPILALFVVILYILIQQIENAMIVPTVMRHAVGLNPIITIAAISAGGTLAGISGAIIAIPVAATLSILLKEIWKHNKQKITSPNA